MPKLQPSTSDPIVVHGVMNAFEDEEVPSQFRAASCSLANKSTTAAVLVAGSAAFLAEPYYYATICAGDRSSSSFIVVFTKASREQGQMLGMIEPSEALGVVLEEMAKVAAAVAD